MITLKEFTKTTYHTAKNVVVPLLNIRLDKSEFIVKGKYHPEILEARLQDLYVKNIEKFK